MPIDNFNIVIITRPLEKILINDKTFKSDERGVIELKVDDIYLLQNKGISEFDLWLSDILLKSQRKLFYETLVRSGRFGVVDVASMLKIEKWLAKEILLMAFRHEIVDKCETQWRISKGKKLNIEAWIKAHYGEREEMQKPSMTLLPPPSFKLKKDKQNSKSK